MNRAKQRKAARLLSREILRDGLRLVKLPRVRAQIHRRAARGIGSLRRISR